MKSGFWLSFACCTTVFVTTWEKCLHYLHNGGNNGSFHDVCCTHALKPIVIQARITLVILYFCLTCFINSVMLLYTFTYSSIILGISLSSGLDYQVVLRDTHKEICLLLQPANNTTGLNIRCTVASQRARSLKTHSPFGLMKRKPHQAWHKCQCSFFFSHLYWQKHDLHCHVVMYFL